MSQTMVISNHHHFIFVHIIKAAGTSITRELDRHLAWNDIVLGATPLGDAMQWPYHRRFDLHKHSTAQEIKKVVQDDIWDSYFTFTFVRNPYDRAVSLYTWIEKMVKNSGYVRYPLFKFMRKKDFWSFPGTNAYLRSRSFSEFIRDEHLLNNAPGMKPQSEWITDDHDRVIVDYIGKVENIDNDLKHVGKALGFGFQGLGIHNRSGSHQQSKYLKDSRDLDFLYHRFQKDFNVLGYDPDPEPRTR